MKKSYRVADVKREKKIGVAAGTLEELIAKSCIKMGFSSTECRLFVAEDGTRVDDDDYLAMLPQRCLLILLKEEEEMVTNIGRFCNEIRSLKKDYIAVGLAATELFATNTEEKLQALRRNIAAADDASTRFSERTQDPDWFEGLEPSEKTKEQSMSKRAKDRMRGYYYKTKTALHNSNIYVNSKNGCGKELIDQFLKDLDKLLIANKYNEKYFNRKASDERLCSTAGLFKCGGLWNNRKCQYEVEHIINPYRSKEERIIFQTWNLDHTIELSRSIIPKILEAIKCLSHGGMKCGQCNQDTMMLETDKYYLQIFTKTNLKLVHIVCHYKGKHDADSDVYTVCNNCRDRSIACEN